MDSEGDAAEPAWKLPAFDPIESSELAASSSGMRKRGHLVGERLADRYVLDSHLGSGGMGDVYLGRHTKINKAVAVKVLGDEYGGDTVLTRRFLQEAQAASKIRHENIVDISDFGHTDAGLPFFAMEYLEGETLSQTLETEGRIPWERASKMMLHILSALGAAHGEGVVHRDMKPSNCQRLQHKGDRDFVKVLDFGIAKFVDDDGVHKTLTRTGVVMGTAAYMSPEQAQSKPLDARTDLYSAGVLFFQMLTGRLPFEAPGFVGVLTQHITEKPPSLRAIAPDAGITRAMEAVVLRALEKDPEERYASAADFAEAIRTIDSGRRTGRGWWLAGAALLVAGAVAWSRGSGDDEVPTHAAAAAAPAVGPEPEPAPQPQADPGPSPPADPEPPPDPEPEPPEPEPEPATTPPDSTAPPDEEADQLPAKADATSIRRALKRRSKAVRNCGDKHGALPGMGIRVKVELEVAANGSVTAAKPLAQFADTALGRCVARAAADAKLPAARKGQIFTHTFPI